jgi:hypothetical protein
MSDVTFDAAGGTFAGTDPYTALPQNAIDFGEGFTMAIKRWNGSAFVNAPLQRWNGSAFVTPEIHRYDGTGFVRIQ